MPRGKPFKKGQPRPKGAGRKKGTPNKLGASLKLSFLEAFKDLGGIDGLVSWARKHKTTFYTLCARLLPQSIEGEFSVATTRHLDADMMTDEQLLEIASRCRELPVPKDDCHDREKEPTGEPAGSGQDMQV